MTESKPTPMALATAAAITLPPIVGAAMAIALHRWEPLAYGALSAVGLLVALVVGSGVVDAREARRIDSGARSEVHSDCGELERLRNEVQLLRDREAMRRTLQAKKQLVVRLGSESGKREPDSTSSAATESPDQGHPGA